MVADGIHDIELEVTVGFEEGGVGITAEDEAAGDLAT
jgi:hypothetical protein